MTMHTPGYEITRDGRVCEIARRLKEIRDELEWALEMYQTGFWPEGLRHDGNP